jgi:hypothetical protein
VKHWAAKFIGADYESVGRCWGLVRIICRERFGEDMPGLALGSLEDNTAAIKRAADGLGWRRVAVDIPQADDIVVMQGPDGRHVAWAVDYDGTIGVVHACNLENGVEAHRWRELKGLAFHSFDFWRRSQ